MKKRIQQFVLVFITLLSITPILRGQTQLPNGSFETWVNKHANGNPYSDPQSWYTLNSLVAFGYEPSTVVTNTAKTGDKAVLLESLVGPFNNIPGLLTLKNIIDNSGQPNLNLNKIGFKGRPTKLEFWYQSHPEIGDANAVIMLLTKWNSGKQVVDTIAVAEFSADSVIENYIKASIELVYFSNETPDSLFFLASSSLDGFSPIVGSWFLLDDLSFAYPNNLSETIGSREIKVYPNPFNQNISLEGLEAGQLYSIIAINGAILQSGILEKSMLVNTEEIGSGIYILKIQGKSSSKFIKIIKN
jgi:hypothetical protein